MRLADEAWKEVDATTIRQCWKKSGILPDIAPAIPRPLVPISSLLATSDLLNPIMDTEMEVSVALDKLQQRGVLQALNRMSLKDLLNPVEELCTVSEMSDDEIYCAVVEAQHHDLMTNDDSIEDDPVDPPPTRCEALEAALAITKYVKDMNDPLA